MTWQFWRPPGPGYDEDAPDSTRYPKEDSGENYIFTVVGSTAIGTFLGGVAMPGMAGAALGGCIGFAMGAVCGIVKARKVDDALADRHVLDGELDVENQTEEVLSEYRDKFRRAGATRERGE